jgi:hypothetical protein
MSNRDVGEVGTTSNPSPYNEENYNKIENETTMPGITTNGMKFHGLM